MKKTLITTAIALLTTALFSCQKSATENLKDAQLCLNSSAPADARGCLSKIESDTSALANKLRCSAVFISEGFNTPASFISALDKLNSPGTCGTGCSSTVNAVTALSFKSGNNVGGSAAAVASRQRNLDVSAEAYTYCEQSETPIYFQISSLFRIGTLASMTAYSVTGVAGTTPTETEIKTALGALPAADLGAIAIATYQATCQNIANASDSTKTYCAQLAATQGSGSGSATDVGICFKLKLNDPNAVCAP